MRFFMHFFGVSENSKIKVLLIISMLFPTLAFPQQEIEHQELLEWHDQEIGIRSLGIINGPVYEFIRITGQTHAYFNTQYWSEGDIRIDGQTYFNLQLVYNLHVDQIITKHPDLRYTLGISLKNVESFHIYNRSFVLLQHPDITTGYYEESFKGSLINIYLRREKKARVGEKNTEFVLLSYIFMESGGSFRRFKRMRDLYKTLPESESRIRAIRKEYKLRPSEKNFDDLLKLATLLEEGN